MDLLLFAHRGEAQEFIKYYGLKPDPKDHFLYQGKERLLFISGEGIYEVFAKLGQLLGRHPIKKVINLGIAGSLSPKVKVGEFHSIRTVYAYGEQALFQSFTLQDNSAELDLITSTQRVLDDEVASQLSCFAPIVDRELWAAAKTCAQAKVELFSYKLISDMAGAETACFDLKQRALEFSSELLKGYLGLDHSSDLSSDQEMNQMNAQKEALETPIPMSFTQKARYLKAMNALNISQEFNHKDFNDTFFSDPEIQRLPQKQKANLYIDRLECELNPLKKLTKDRFDMLSQEAKDIGANLIFDKNFEKKKFVLQMEINNQKNLDKLSQVAAKIKFKDFERVWDGNRDV